jgi:hypothetical protein
MTRLPRLPTPSVTLRRDFLVEEASLPGDGEWDVFLGTIGFEERSRFILSQISDRVATRIVSAYDSRRLHSFTDNMEFALGSGCEVMIESDIEFVDQIGDRIRDALSRSEGRRVVVDISSASRTRIAATVAELLEHDVVVDYFYAPAEFREPSDVPSALSYTGPVLPRFVGRAADMNTPLTAIVGLGYESIEALGAFQLLEASEVWAFVPMDVAGFAEIVEEENASLLQLIDPRHALRYSVEDPLELYEILDQVVYGALASSRPVLVPLGPKIFALASLLVSARYERTVPVWRFSSEQYGRPVEVRASGNVIGLRVRHRGDAPTG